MSTCQLCNQRPATARLTEVQPDGSVAEAHLCPTCVERHELDLAKDPPPVSALLALAATVAAAADVDASAHDPRCRSCGLRWSEYQANNLFGCAHCLEHLPVAEAVERYHGAAAHRGRVPGASLVQPPARAPRRSRRLELERQLEDAVAAERYEEAARLRDAIRALGSSL